jgi:mRNA interferase RelE/StbE
MYRVEVAPRAKQELKTLTKLYRKAFAQALEELKDNPFAGKPLTRDLAGKLVYKIGVYRIVYKINQKDKIVSILSAGHRKTIYQ